MAATPFDLDADTPPWLRQPGESDDRYTQFRKFLAMGAGRTLVRAAEVLGLSYAQTRHLAWAGHWTERAAAYEDELETMAAMGARAIAPRLELKALAALEKLLDGITPQLPDRNDPGKQISARDAGTLAVGAAKAVRTLIPAAAPECATPATLSDLVGTPIWGEILGLLAGLSAHPEARAALAQSLREIAPTVEARQC